MNPVFDARGLVLVIAGHDPSGGAGIQADIETATALGGRCATLVTATTTQNTERFVAIHPQPAGQFREQARLLLDDMRFAACKIGLLGTAELADCVAEMLSGKPRLPVVLDPVSHAGVGSWSADERLLGAIRQKLAPLLSLITPNRREARELTGFEDMGEAARRLLDAGCGAVLIKGVDETDPGRPDVVIHHLYRDGSAPIEQVFPRLPHNYHGSGCTLSTAIATELAFGETLEHAVDKGLKYTYSALLNARPLGGGQWHPERAPERG